MNSAPKSSKPLGGDGMFVKVWSVWFDRLKASIDNTGLFIKNQVNINTSDASSTVIQTLVLEENKTYNIKAMIVGNSVGERASYEIECTAYRVLGGAFIQGVTSYIHSSESNALMNVFFNANGNNIDIEVIGLAGIDIKWGCFLEWVKV